MQLCGIHIQCIVMTEARDVIYLFMLTQD